jgi:hypothetical protein
MLKEFHGLLTIFLRYRDLYGTGTSWSSMLGRKRSDEFIFQEGRNAIVLQLDFYAACFKGIARKDYYKFRWTGHIYSFNLY